MSTVERLRKLLDRREFYKAAWWGKITPQTQEDYSWSQELLALEINKNLPAILAALEAAEEVVRANTRAIYSERALNDAADELQDALEALAKVES